MEHKRTTNHSTFIHPKGVFCLENEWFGLSSTVSVLPALRLLHDSIDHPKIYRLRMTFYVDSGRSFQRLQPPVSTLTVSVPPSI